MAHIEKRGQGRWRARYRSPDGSEKSQTFPRRIDAEKWLATIEGDKARGIWIDPAAARVTFGDFAQQWRAMQVHRATTAASVDSMLRHHILPQLGHRPIGAVRPSELQAWVKGRAEVLAPSTVATVVQVVVSIFRAAVADRVIPSSPTIGLKLPQQVGGEVRPLTPEQVGALAGAVANRYRALVIAGAGTGLRAGELLGLTVDRVDFLRRSIHVDRQLVTLVGQAPYLGPPKTPSSVRTVPAPQLVLDELARHIAAFPPGPYGVLFTHPNGQPIHRSHLGHVWRRAARAVGPPGVHFHDLRHFAASALIASGASVKSVQHFLGHASAKVTLDTYAHLWPDDEERTRAALESALAPVLVGVDDMPAAEALS